jgi:hypothetical protein
MKDLCKECTCDSHHIKLFLVFCFDLTDNRVELVAICRTSELAEKYKTGYKKLTTRTWIEERLTDHALGAIMLGKKF